MRIAHVCLSLGKGGAEKLLVDSLPYYIGRGHDVTIVQLSSILEEPSYIQTVENAGINVVTWSKGGFKSPRYLLKVFRLLRSKRYDVVHIHLFPTMYYFSFVARLIKHCPVLVMTEHCTSNRRSNKKILQPLEKFIYKRYDAIVAVSENVETMLVRRFPKLKAKIQTVKNGVDIGKFQSAIAYDAAYFQTHFNLAETDVKLFMASRFSYPKDQHTIIRAMEFLPPKCHVFFAGDGEEMENARLLAKEMKLENRVHFLGFRTDIPKLMKSADINMLSSLYEGFSGVTLEALASGRSFLGADVAGINDVVPNTHFLFESQNPERLAQKITALISDSALRFQMTQIGLEHIKQFDMQGMIDAHIRLYADLLADES